MTTEEILNQFSKIGYLIQEPNGKDNTYFFVNHTEATTRTVWLKLKKIPEITAKLNYRPVGLTNTEETLISELIGNLGYSNYKVLTE